MVHDLWSGFDQLLTPEAIGLLFVGMLVGMFMGMLPGLGVSLALSVMLPFLYHMSVVPAVALMLGALASSYYSASITAILLNTPGAPESFPTTLDGFPMAQRGEAGRALAISATSTLFGGLIGCVILIGLLQVAGQLINVFHPPEFAAIIVLALVLIGGTGESARTSKVILSGAFGFMLSFIGSDPVTGVERFTFGMPSLFSGINVVPFALGVFALTQMVLMYGRKESVAKTDSAALARQFRQQIPIGIRDTFRNWFEVVRSAVVASLLGLIPGVGGFTANFISYSLGRQTSKHRRDFGTGSPAGVASAEGSSLAKEVGSLVPAVALGLPSGLGMVIFIAALSILGLQPGPTLLKTQPALPYTMMWVMAIAGVVSCVVGLLLTPWLSRVTSVRGPLLFPFILALSILGSFAAVTNFAGVIEVAIFAGIGLVMRKLNYSLAAITIGLVLGTTFADNVHLTRSIYGWDFLTQSPLADVFLAAAVALLVLTSVRARGERRAMAGNGSTSVAGSTGVAGIATRGGDTSGDHPLLEPVADAVIAAISIVYMVVSLGYPPDAGQLPAIVSAIAAALALFRLVVHLAGRGGHARTPVVPAALAEPLEPDVPAPATVGAGAHRAQAGGSGPPDTGSRAVTLPVGESPAARPGAPGGSTPHWREVVALGWVVALVVATYLFGFELGVALGVAAYCLVSADWDNQRARWLFAGSTTAVAFGMAYAFVNLFHLSFTGLILNA